MGVNGPGQLDPNTVLNPKKTIDMATLTRKRTQGPLLKFADNGDNKIGVGDVAYKTLPNGTQQALPVVGMEDLAYYGNSPVGIKLGKYGADGQIEKNAQGQPIVSEVDITSRDRLKQASAILNFESSVTTGELPKKDKLGNEIYKNNQLVLEKREALPGEIATNKALAAHDQKTSESAAKVVEKDNALIDNMAGGGVGDSYPVVNNFFKAKRDARDAGGTYNNPKYDAASANLSKNVVNVDNPADGLFNNSLASGLSLTSARNNIEAKARQHLSSPTIDKEIAPKLLQDYTDHDMRK